MEHKMKRYKFVDVLKLKIKKQQQNGHYIHFQFLKHDNEK